MRISLCIHKSKGGYCKCANVVGSKLLLLYVLADETNSCQVNQTNLRYAQVDLKVLIEMKLIGVGDEIVCKKKVGSIAADGIIEYMGKRMKSVSSFAHECGVKSTVSGWRCCRVNGQTLQDIREMCISGDEGKGAASSLVMHLLKHDIPLTKAFCRSHEQINNQQVTICLHARRCSAGGQMVPQ